MQKTTPPVVWHISDGRKGHDNQSLGLIDALLELQPLHSISVSALKPPRLVKAAFTRHWPGDYAEPDIIVAAGHGTHLSVLLASHLYKAKTALLMQPSLPKSWFDYCLIPEHDGIKASDQILLTNGALNRIRPATEQNSKVGLILIGGASQHYHDSDADLFNAINDIVTRCPEIHWHMGDSPRSSENSRKRLQQLKHDNLDYTPWQDSDPDWLQRQLQQASYVWVSEDSMSMIYEALSAGAQVGLLPMQRKQNSRLHKAIDQLSAQNRVCSYQLWQTRGKLLPAQTPLQEASRCAAELIDRGLFNPEAKT